MTFKEQILNLDRPLSREQRREIAAYIGRLESDANQRRLGYEEAAFKQGMVAGRLDSCSCTDHKICARHHRALPSALKEIAL